MTKEEIYNNYAIEQGFDSWEDLYIQSDMVFRHFDNVTELIQEELKKKIVNDLIGNFFTNEDRENTKKEILNTEML